VTVGTIEALSRLEPVAVGTAVNLAARLCAHAANGQILVEARTVELASELRTTAFRPLEAVRLKGFSREVRVFEAGRELGGVRM
jgi:class 3 adenylate cyclase